MQLERGQASVYDMTSYEIEVSVEKWRLRK